NQGPHLVDVEARRFKARLLRLCGVQIIFDRGALYLQLIEPSRDVVGVRRLLEYLEGSIPQEVQLDQFSPQRDDPVLDLGTLSVVVADDGCQVDLADEREERRLKVVA